MTRSTDEQRPARPDRVATAPPTCSRTREAVRVVLLDADSRVLLFEGRDLAGTADEIRFWFTVGGGVADGESLCDAARRELLEETGQTDLTLVGPLHRREFEYVDHGVPRRQIEHFFVARTASVEVAKEGWTELERTAMLGWRWWAGDDLEADDVCYFPAELPDLVRLAALLV